MKLGLPDTTAACLFDLDGVLTSTAVLHRRAWRQVFDEFLAPKGQPPFTEEDYVRFVDGRPRYDGVRTFLAARDITLPEGSPDDPPDAQTVQGVGNRKNDLIDAIIRTEGVTPYPGTVAYLDAVRAQGLRIGVVTSSANAGKVLEAAGLTAYVEALVDGNTIASGNLRGKPAPDSFLTGAGLLDTPVDRAAVFEDALAGVEAGRAGKFGYVVGVDRAGQAEALRRSGADVVVTDLADLL
ncbi:beta-phosphoglucomutase family hydrolase [Saccharothrix violaceirubra]|uniref:Beta-phosphoglucomutase n=1 Tax=Saccharothrix violaceirubra TaxID=413306 RepID=A0A7W7WX54_9PSEU|nr:beta-phosphoglucomutase family hydrolase [Saccharothrix violaceirubra]MBB4967084.1 beta-phosphoglucomutase family hydrolase [Saccharothrix violaceirubra]